MHDIVTMIQVIGTFVGAVATAVAVAHKSNRKDYDSIIDTLKKQRDDCIKYYHEERKRRLQAEKEIERLKKKIDELKKRQ